MSLLEEKRLLARDQDWPPAEQGKSVGGGTMLEHLLCGASVSSVFLQIMVFGANTTLLAAFASMLNLLVCAWVVALTWTEANDRFWTRLAPLVGMFVLALVLGAVPMLDSQVGSRIRSADRAALELLKLLGVGAAFLTGALVVRRKSRLGLLCNWMAGGGFALLLLSIGLWRQDTGAVWGQPKETHIYRFTATLFNANAAACLAGCFGLLALGLGYTALRKDQERARFEAWVIAAAAGMAYGLAGWSVLLAASRTSLVSLTLLTTAFIGLALLRSGGRVAERRETWLLGGGALLLLALAGLIGGSPIASRAFESDDMDIRIATWRIVMHAIAEKPWLGHGLGSFGLVHQAHITVQNAAAIWDMNAAHQVFLQAAMEGGLPFSLLLATIVAVVMIQGGIAWVTPKLGRWCALSVMLCLVMILFCGSVDIALNVPAIASLFGLLLGALWSWSDTSARGRGSVDSGQVGGVEA